MNSTPDNLYANNRPESGSGIAVLILRVEILKKLKNLLQCFYLLK